MYLDAREDAETHEAEEDPPTAFALKHYIERFFETSPLLTPHVMRENDRLPTLEYKILEKISLEQRASAKNNALNLNQFDGINELCNDVARAMSIRRNAAKRGSAFAPYPNPALYERAERMFRAKSMAHRQALDTALARGKLDLREINLAKFTRMKFVTEFLWRHQHEEDGGNVRIYEVDLAGARGFDADIATSTALLLPHTLVWAALLLPGIKLLNMNNTRASELCCACIAYAMLARQAHGLDMRVVELSRCYVRDTGAALWGLVLQQPTCALTKLTLSRAKIGNAGAGALAIGLSKAKALVYLDLADNGIGRRGVQDLGRALLENPVLEELLLDRNYAGSRGACALASFLLHPDCKLKVLHLESNDIGPRGGKALCVAVSRNTCLLELHVSKNQLGNVGAAGFGTCLARNHTLHLLDVSDCDITDVGLAAIGLGLRVNETLQHLICHDSVIADAGCIQLAQSLAMNANSRLVSLDLSMNLIRNEGIYALAEYISLPICVLDHLLLCDNGITDRGADRITHALLANASYSQLQTVDLSGNPISRRMINGAIYAINTQAGRFKRVSVQVDGSHITRRNVHYFGAMVARFHMRGAYYQFLLVFTIFSQWFDLGFDIYVSYNQVMLAVAEPYVLRNIVYAALLVFFVALPYFFILFLYGQPENRSQYSKTGWCCSAWTRARVLLFFINALHVRTAYEVYRSLHAELTTVSLGSVRLVQCVFGAIPQSLIQLHILLSSTNLLVIEREGLFGNWNIVSILVSLCFSFGVTSSTVSFIFEERYLTRWKRVDWVYEETVYVFGVVLAFVYHFAHYLFRGLFLVLVASFYGPALGAIIVLFGLLLRLSLWFLGKSNRRLFFILVSYIVGNSSWDKRRIARHAHLIEFIELCLVVAPFWIPTSLVERIPDNNLVFELGFQKQEWLDLQRVVGPIPLTALLGGSWLVGLYLYFAFIEQLHPFFDVVETCDLNLAEALALEPFELTRGGGGGEQEREDVWRREKAMRDFLRTDTEQRRQDFDML